MLHKWQRDQRIVVTIYSISSACGIFGILIGTGGSLLLGKVLFQMTIYPAPWITGCAFAFSVLLGIIFGLYPAVKAANLQPVEALRAE